MWSFRLRKELDVSSSADFITLTYSERTLPFNCSGEVTLVKRHLQLFLKRLRKQQSKYTGGKIRYYGVGEYGTLTDRPHYHLLLFNLDSRTSPERSWNYGHIHHGRVSDASIHYVTKYHVNVVKDPESTRQVEFSSMSRRPGLGYNYVEKVINWHRDNDYTHVVNNGYKQAMPRYYREKIFSKMERALQSESSIELVDDLYWQEYYRLQGLGIQDPDRHMFASQLREARKVKKKGLEGNTF